jgi:hypothetical protein
MSGRGTPRGAPARVRLSGDGGRIAVGTPGSRLIGAVLAVVGVALLVIGLLTLRGHTPEKPNAAPPATLKPATPSGNRPSSGVPSTTVPPTTVEPTSAVPGTGAPSTGASSTGAPNTGTTPPPAARAPLTVLNNSKVSGLAERVADQARGRGWQVAQVGNFAGRLPATTVYYTPGDDAGQRAARQFAADFPAVDRVLPRYDGLPPTPPGIVLVVTKDWPPDP